MQNLLPKNRHSQNILPIFSLLLLLFTGCSIAPARSAASANDSTAENPNTSTDSEFHSGTIPKNCLLCGDSSGTLLPIYSGQNNIGIISLNTFQIAPVCINQYDDNGNLIEEPSSSHSIHITKTSDNGFFLMVTEDTDRGIAQGTLSFNQDEFLDMDKAASLLCSDCLSQALGNNSDMSSTGMFVIDFYTHKIRMFRENITAFQFDDYYISCRAKDRQTDNSTLEMDLLIFYCPKRYGD